MKLRLAILICSAALAAPMVPRSAPRLHNASIFVKNMETSLQFYSLLGFSDTHRFTVDKARAAWIGSDGGSTPMLELIELPTWLPKGAEVGTESSGEPVLKEGLSHVALDVTAAAKEAAPEAPRLGAYLKLLNGESEDRFQKSLTLLEEPDQFMFGPELWETAVIRDPNGVRLELMSLETVLSHKMMTWKTAEEEALERLQQGKKLG